tara:strand:- start:1913 stop:2212 length:300 start_codon:yes stop_codon:yes gene_type:complete
MNSPKQERLEKGVLRVFNYQISDGYRMGKKHGELFITDWSIDDTEKIIQYISTNAKGTWSIACVENYNFKVTVRFIEAEDAKWFEQSELNNNFEREMLL